MKVGEVSAKHGGAIPRLFRGAGHLFAAVKVGRNLFIYNLKTAACRKVEGEADCFTLELVIKRRDADAPPLIRVLWLTSSAHSAGTMKVAMP